MNDSKIDGFEANAAQEHLQRLLASRFFSKKANAKRLLEFLVASTIDGTAASLTRKDVLRACFSANAEEELVSTEKRRLRRHLQEYYAAEGRDSPEHFEVGHEPGFRIAIRPADKGAAVEIKLFGRRNELLALSDSFQDAQAGSFRIVCLEGAAGFGKTALVHAHLRNCKTLCGHLHVGISVARYVEFSAQSYEPVEEALHSLCLSTDGSYRPEMRLKLEKLASTWAVRIEGKPGASPPSKLQLARFLAAVSSTAPTLLILEDIHLADPVLFSLIDHLVQAAPPSVQIVLTYRPESLRLPEWLLSLSSHQCVARLRLGALEKPDVAAFLNDRFQPNVFPPELATMTWRLAEGCPLYVKRIAEHLMVRRLVVTDTVANRECWRLNASLDEISSELPEDLESIIHSSLARLTPQEQSLVFAAALQGEEFESLILSQALTEEPSTVERQLKAIAENSGLIHFLRSSAVGGRSQSARYRFKHTLYYRGALRASEREPTLRVQWSLSTANALLSLPFLDANSASTAAALLSSAGQQESSLPHFLRAAKEQLSSYFHHTCQQTARAGIAAAESCEQSARNDTCLVELLTILGVSTMATKGFADPDLRQTFGRALEIAERRQLNAALPALLYGVWVYRASREGLASAFEFAQRLADIEDIAAKPGAIRGLFAVGISQFLTGDPRHAAEKFLQLAAKLSAAKDPADGLFTFQIDMGVVSRCQAARALCLLGQFARSRAMAAEAIEAARRTASPQSIAYSLSMAASVYALLEEFTASKAFAGEAVGLSAEYGFFQEQIWATVIHSYSANALNPDTNQLERCRRACEIYQTSGCTTADSELNSMLAKICLAHGQVSLAIQVLERTLAQARQMSEAYFVPELLRLKAECLALTGEGNANYELRNSLELARAQGSLRWELSTLLRLNELVSAHQSDARYQQDLPLCLAKFIGETGPLLEAARRSSGRSSVAAVGV